MILLPLMATWMWLQILAASALPAIPPSQGKHLRR
jgi:hypothetical protein